MSKFLVSAYVNVDFLLEANSAEQAKLLVKMAMRNGRIAVDFDKATVTARNLDTLPVVEVGDL